MAALEGVALASDIEAALQDLPEDPEQCYSKAVHRMKRATGAKQKLAFEALAWVAFVFRPLTEDELRHALSFNKHEDKLDITTEDCVSMANISAYCCGLVLPDMQKTVRFVHYSAKEYFRSHRDTLFGGFHLVAAWTCAKYLSSIPISLGDSSGDDESTTKERRKHTLVSNLKHFPFAFYAGTILHKHYEEIRNQPKESMTSIPDSVLAPESFELASYQTFITHAAVIDLMGFLIEQNDRRMFFLDVLERHNAYYQHHQVDNMNGSYRSCTSYCVTCSPLHMAAFLGCSSLVEMQLEKGLVVNELDSYGQSPLLITFKKRFGDIAGILLQRGASADLATAHGYALLLYASQMNYDDAVKAIISRNAGPREALIGSLFTLMFSPVIIVLYLVGMLIGNMELVPLSENISAVFSAIESVKEGVEEHTSDFSLYCEVLLAAYNGDYKVIAQHLLALGTEDDPRSPETAYLSEIWPSDSDSDDSDSGSFKRRSVWQNFRLRDSFLTTACFLAVEGAHIQAVEVLLEHGVNVNVKDQQGQTLLHRATAINEVDLVKFLLYKKARINARDNEGRNALVANADARRKKILELLIENGANIQEFGDTAPDVHEIYRAATHGKTEVLKFFLQNGVDASLVSAHGFAPLHAAAANGHEECVRLLLRNGANPSSISRDGQTPLDFVRKGKTLHIGVLTRRLGESFAERQAIWRQYAETKFPGLEERYETIDALLTAENAKTSKELYPHGLSEELLDNIIGGRYATSRHSYRRIY